MGARRRHINQRALAHTSEDPFADTAKPRRSAPIANTKQQQVAYILVTAVCLLLLGALVLKAVST